MPNRTTHTLYSHIHKLLLQQYLRKGRLTPAQDKVKQELLKRCCTNSDQHLIKQPKSRPLEERENEKA